MVRSRGDGIVEGGRKGRKGEGPAIGCDRAAPECVSSIFKRRELLNRVRQISGQPGDAATITNAAVHHIVNIMMRTAFSTQYSVLRPQA